MAKLTCANPLPLSGGWSTARHPMRARTMSSRRFGLFPTQLTTQQDPEQRPISLAIERILRRTCARLCRDAGGELDQIQFLLGHVSVRTTERYLGCKQRLHNAVNDRIGITPNN